MRSRSVSKAAPILVATVCVVVAGGCGTKSQPTAETSAPPPAAVAPPPGPPEASPEQKYFDALDMISAAQTNRGRVLTLPAKDFAPDAKSAGSASGAVLDKVAIILRDNPKTRVIIEGFTDDRGTVKADEKLTQERADAVKKILSADHGIDEQRMLARGRGKEAPIGDNHTQAGREANRRVELLFSGIDGTFPAAEDNTWNQG